MARGSVLKRCRICCKYNKRDKKTKEIICKKGVCKDPIYYIAYRVNGVQKRETIGTSKKLAQKILSKRLAQILMGDYSEFEDVKFEIFIEKWLEEHAKPRLKPQTFYNYQNVIKNHLLPAFKGFKLSKINPGHIRLLLTKLISKKSAKTVNNILVQTKTIFNHARKWGYIKENPADDVDKYKEVHQEMDFLAPDEISKILEHAREPFKTIFLLTVMTGMRRAEVLGLQWGDVDWNSDTIFVRRSLYYVKNTDKALDWQFVPPKTKRSVRAIAMSPRLKEALQIHQINSSVNKYDLIFTNKSGNPIDAENMIKREFHPTLRLAGIRKIRFHDLRHSYTSLLIAQGENIKFIQSQLGHASIQTTMDRYGHLLPVDNKRVGSQLDNQVFGGENTQNNLNNLKVGEKKEGIINS